MFLITKILCSNLVLRGIILLSILHVTAVVALAQYNHSYPRTASQSWGGAPADWYARFDLVMRPLNQSQFDQIRAINPNTLVFPTGDINAGYFFYSSLPDEWITRNSRGQKITIYGASDVYLANFSDFCGNSSQYGGMKYSEYVPIMAQEYNNLSEVSGIATDGLWDYPWEAEVQGDIDLDRNGVNDYKEHGKNWVDKQWAVGTDKILSGLRRVLGDKPLLVNSGWFHYFGWEYTNGVMNEHFSTIYNLDWILSQYTNFMKQAPLPHVIFWDGESAGLTVSAEESKNDFMNMRFLLCLALMGDGYFSFSDIPSGEHFYDKYYDELDLDLGYPTGDFHRSGSDILVRFFTKGAAIFNPSGRTQTVTNQTIESLSGYNGPYYFFRGGQDPKMNSGRLFQQVTLYSQSGSDNEVNGDGVVLLTRPIACIADIIIDNVDAGTSPASKQVDLQGNWTQEYSNNKNFCMVIANWMGLSGYAYASGGGNNRAIFRPTIGCAGRYEVFEWHGHHHGSEASNVTYVINYGNNESKSFVINQRQDQGRWNSLGVYYFKDGTEGNVTISTIGASGVVIADAVKFVYQRGENEDVTAPAAPIGVKVQLP